MMIRLNVNGHEHELEADPDTPLLYVLREDLGLNGAKFGCGLGQCGACTVIVDGRAVFSCLTPIAVLPGRVVRTIEGLGTIQSLNAVQRAFITEQAAQCGYCIAGMVMRAQALLEHNPHPSEQDIRQHMAVNLCRCGTHMRILAAVRRAAAGQGEAAAAGDAGGAGIQADPAVDRAPAADPGRGADAGAGTGPQRGAGADQGAGRGAGAKL